MAADAKEERTARLLLALVVALFLAKAMWLALFVTPLWDVPDESAHYAYAAELSAGHGLPVYGETPLPPEVLARWSPGAAQRPPFNWAAQHPPAHPILAAVFVRVAEAAGAGLEGRVRAARAPAALAGAAALLVFFLTFRAAGVDPNLSAAFAAAISFIPMYSHLSAGVHHESLAAFAGGLAAFSFFRLMSTGRFADGIAMAAALAFAGAVKLTAVPLALALLALAAKYLASRGARRAAEWSTFAVISLSVPALWALRNLRTTGEALVVAAPRAFRAGDLLELLHREPVLDHTFKNFLGLIGWTGRGELAWFQISGAYLLPFLLLALAASLAGAVWLWRSAAADAWSRRARLVSVAVFAAALLGLPSTGGAAGWAKRLVYASLAALPFFGLPAVWSRARLPLEVIRASQLVVVVFSLAYLFNAWRGWAIYGAMRAVHGRYFFVILPFLALAYLYPAMQAARRRALAWGVVLALAASEGAFLLREVLPFYRTAP